MFDKNDVIVIRSFYGDDVARVDEGAVASIDYGEPVKRGGTGNNFAILLATGDPEGGTDIFLGVASADSSDTVAADGVVRYEIVGPGTVLRADATTVANIDTDAKLLLLEMDFVAFDLTGTVFTIDEDEADDPNVHGLMIKGGDIAKGTLDVYTAAATVWGSTV